MRSRLVLPPRIYRFTPLAVSLLMAAPIAATLPASSAQAATRCEQAQVNPGLTSARPKDLIGDAMKAKTVAGRRISLMRRDVRIVASGNVDAVYATLVHAGTPVSSYDKVRIQISTNGGSSVWASCGGATGPGVAAGWFMHNASKYTFRACGYLPTPYGRSWYCTSWW